MNSQHIIQVKEQGNFNPEIYFRTIPEFQEDQFDDLAIDQVLANEFFHGDYELSVTCDQQSDVSKLDFERHYFHNGLNVLDNNFIRNFDVFQTKHPPKSMRKLRSNTLNLVGFSNLG